MKTNTENQNQTEIFHAAMRKLVECEALLASIDWTTPQVSDAKLGNHFIALHQHLDNAKGRLSTVSDCARRLL